MPRRKYTRSGETPEAYKCDSCGHELNFEDKILLPNPESLEIGGENYCCPKCHHDVFLGLLKPIKSKDHA